MKRGFSAVGQHFAQENQGVAGHGGIDGDGGDEIVGRVLLNDHTGNCGHPVFLRDMNFAGFELWNAVPFDPTLEKPVQIVDDSRTKAGEGVPLRKLLSVPVC